jgi:hypothetical protein
MAQSFRRAIDGVEPSREARSRLAERLAAASRRRSILPSRIAAAAVLAIAAGVVAWALSARPSAEQLALAEKLREVRSREAQIERLQNEAEPDLVFLREQVAEKRDDPRVLVVNVGLSSIERQLSAGPQPSAVPRNADVNRVSIVTTVNGAPVQLVQGGDGRVTVTLPSRTVQAASMTELQRRHPDLCSAWAIAGSEGKVRVGEAAAVVELPVRLDLLFRTGSWDEDLPWEAYRDWMKGRFQPQEVERRMKEMQERWRRAAESAPVPAVAIDFESVLKDVRGIGKHEAHEAARKVEEQAKALEKRLREMHELRARARGLRAFVEDVKKEK